MASLLSLQHRWVRIVAVIITVSALMGTGQSKTHANTPDIVLLAGGGAGDGLPAVNQSVFPEGLAIGPDNDLYIVDGFWGLVLKVDSAGRLHTVVGGVPVDNGAEGPNAGTILSNPSDIVFDRQGNLYISDQSNYRVLKLDPAGNLSLYAGGGEDHQLNNIPATDAFLQNPEGMAVDAAGDLYIVPFNLNQVVKVDHSTGIMTVVAGTGQYGYSGDGGPATSAELQYPSSVAVDSQGNIYIADQMNFRIRRIDASSGIISTVAGTGQGGDTGDGGPATQAEIGEVTSLRFDANGNLDFTERYGRVRRITPSGTISTAVASPVLTSATGIAVDARGNLIVSDQDAGYVIRVAPNGTSTVVAGNGEFCFAGDGGPATGARFQDPEGMAVEADGSVLVADYGNNRLRRIAPDGTITTIAGTGVNTSSGDGGPASAAGLFYPYGVVIDGQGRIYVSEVGGNRIRRIDPDGTIHTIAGTGTCSFSGDGGPATQATLCYPQALVMDSHGNLYVADHDNERVRRIDQNGIITTVAGNGTFGDPNDGGPALQAAIGMPEGLALDSAGNLYISTSQNVVRKVVLETGIISRFAGTYSGGTPADGQPATQVQLWEPGGLAVDSQGDLFIGEIDGAPGAGQDVRFVDTHVIIWTEAGGHCLMANGFTTTNALTTCFEQPQNLLIDGAGNLYVADQYLWRIWKIAPVTLAAEPVASGWNLLDVPVDAPEITSASTLTASLTESLGAGMVGEIAVYQNGRFALYVPGYSSDFPLSPGEGIFVRAATGGTWKLMGRNYLVGQEVHLQPGWNLVAAPAATAGMQASTIAAQLESCSPAEIAIFRNGSYQVWTPGSDDFRIPYNSGMWIQCTAAQNWSPQ